MKIARFVAPFALALLAACASAKPASNTDQGVAGEGEATPEAALDKNPDGVPYPTDNIGTNPRLAKNAGNRIFNYKFLGYPDADRTKGLQPVSLANYYDPDGKRYKMIHIMAAGTWCTYCQKEAEIVAPIKAKLDERKVVWLQSHAEGPTPGSPATKADLEKWMDNFGMPYTHLWDPGNKNFGPFYDAAALPWNANIYAKTMEILSSGVGGVTTEAALLKDLDEQLKLIDDGVVK